MSTHAFLSPSASHRWLACPPSAKLCAKITDQSSEYAKQGTDAHSLCAYLIEKALGRDVSNPTENLDYYDQEMQRCAEGYAAFAMEEYAKARQSCGDAEVMIEQKVDFSRWVKGGTGTADCIILSDGTAEVIDFKYGLGIMVSADSEEHGGNPQLMCYCLGILEMFDGIYDIDTLKMAIYQPRRENVSIYTMSKVELLRWAEEVLAPTALLAMEGKGELTNVKSGDRGKANHSLRFLYFVWKLARTVSLFIQVFNILKAKFEIFEKMRLTNSSNCATI